MLGQQGSDMIAAEGKTVMFLLAIVWSGATVQFFKQLLSLERAILLKILYKHVLKA